MPSRVQHASFREAGDQATVLVDDGVRHRRQDFGDGVPWRPADSAVDPSLRVAAPCAAYGPVLADSHHRSGSWDRSPLPRCSAGRVRGPRASSCSRRRAQGPPRRRRLRRPGPVQSDARSTECTSRCAPGSGRRPTRRGRSSASARQARSRRAAARVSRARGDPAHVRVHGRGGTATSARGSSRSASSSFQLAPPSSLRKSGLASSRRTRPRPQPRRSKRRPRRTTSGSTCRRNARHRLRRERERLRGGDAASGNVEALDPRRRPRA